MKNVDDGTLLIVWTVLYFISFLVVSGSGYLLYRLFRRFFPYKKGNKRTQQIRQENQKIWF